MTTMGGWRGVYLAGLLMVPLISAIFSTTEETSATMKGQTSGVVSTSAGPATVVTPTPVSTNPPSNLTTTGNISGRQETAAAPTANSSSPQPQATTAGLGQSAGSTLGPVSTAAPTAVAGYVLLGVIVLCIPVLCWLIIALRRRSRGYSFDLHSPVLLMDPPGTFESVKIDDDTVDLSTFPAANGACLSGPGPGEGVAKLVVPPPSSCLSLDTEQTDRKWDQSDGVSLHITEEEEEHTTTAP